MRFARVFIKNSGGQWCDFPVPPNFGANEAWQQVMIEGAFYSVGAVVPKDMVSHVLMLELAEGQQKPTLVPFPGGKT